MSYIITNNETAALDNLLHTQDSNPIKNTVSPTPSKKAKYTPVTNLDSDLETEATGKQSVKEGYGVPITNHSGFVFEWKDIKQKCKKVTAVVTLPWCRSRECFHQTIRANRQERGVRRQD